MINRTILLLMEQLVPLLATSAVASAQQPSYMKWSMKIRKLYKALRLMEVHKQAEPKFARLLKPLYPYLAGKTADLAMTMTGISVEGLDEEDGYGRKAIMLGSNMGERQNNLDMSFSTNGNVEFEQDQREPSSTKYRTIGFSSGKKNSLRAETDSSILIGGQKTTVTLPHDED